MLVLGRWYRRRGRAFGVVGEEELVRSVFDVRSGLSLEERAEVRRVGVGEEGAELLLVAGEFLGRLQEG